MLANYWKGGNSLRSRKFWLRWYSTLNTYSSERIRSQFVDHFKQHGYTYVPSSSVVPFNDNSLYFVNSGMAQFKPIFLGRLSSQSPWHQLRTAVNSQKCIRISGKHNDLADVGNDTFHHTFFEMLGNWSFNGALTKKEVCSQALELLCGTFNIPQDRLFISYFGGCEEMGLTADEEAVDIWRELGVQSEQLLPRTKDDNFWEMELVGPCGTCTEIHYSYGKTPNWKDTLELWNIVFMQYERGIEGQIRRLKGCHIDTGMGFERLCSILQGKKSSYQTDLFAPILNEIQRQTGGPVYQDIYENADKDGLMRAYRIIADHTRTCTVAIADGIIPENKGLGRLLRRLIRNACFQAEIIGGSTGFLSSLVPVVSDILGNAYPDVRKNSTFVQTVLDQEEERFRKAVTSGRKLFKELVTDAKGRTDTIQTQDLFSFVQKFGLSSDIVFSLAGEAGIKLNEEEFAKAEELERKIGTAGDPVIKRFGFDVAALIKSLQENEVACTNDHIKYDAERDDITGSYSFHSATANVVAIAHDGHLTANIPHFEECLLVLDKTPFFAEAGGQCGDVGMICGQETAIFEVTDVLSEGGYVFHKGTLKTGGVELGDSVAALVDSGHRLGCMQNHTAVHLFLALLERFSNTVIKQRSVSVRAHDAKVGFWCATSITREILWAVEDKVNEYIEMGTRVVTEELPLDEAHAMSNELPIRWLPGELYSDPVRLLWIFESVTPSAGLLGSEHDSVAVSIDPCCGTHVYNSADIKLFRCISFHTSGGSNNYSVLFVTGAAAKAADQLASMLDELVDATFIKLRNGEETIDKWKALKQDVTRSTIPLRSKVSLNQKMNKLSKEFLHSSIAVDETNATV